MPDRTEIITSPQNPKLKAIAALRERKEREATGLCLVEGAREIAMADANGFAIETLCFCGEALSAESKALLPGLMKKARQVLETGAAAFEKVAMREGRDGVVATVKTRQWTWNDLANPPRLILAAQNVEKPGNLGALLRTAEAAGVDALVTLDAKVDVWNPNAIRSSLGCVFRVPVINQDSEEFARMCRDRGIKTVAAALTERSQPHHAIDMRGPVAIVMGSEAWGLTPWWLEHADATAMIPMRGKVDSLNVSVAAGVMVFEALRQRS
ncbi:RNA methyltransferase [bacterium]|nr:RNA methyltransferase [bacterium]